LKGTLPIQKYVHDVRRKKRMKNIEKKTEKTKVQLREVDKAIYSLQREKSTLNKILEGYYEELINTDQLKLYEEN
jgi:hypothetical protein